MTTKPTIEDLAVYLRNHPDGDEWLDLAADALFARADVALGLARGAIVEAIDLLHNGSVEDAIQVLINALPSEALDRKKDVSSLDAKRKLKGA